MRHRYSDDDEPMSRDEFAEQIKQELRDEYTRSRNQEKFWDEFYGAHPELRADKHTVLAVYNENIEELMNSTPDEAMDALSTLSNERVDWLKRTEHQRREAAVFVGGPGMEGKPARAEGIFDGPTTTGAAYLKQRRNARREAFNKGFRSDSPTDAPTYGRKKVRTA